VLCAVQVSRWRPVRISAGRQEQPDPLGVAHADRGGQRGGLAHGRRVAEQQAEALVVVVAEAGQVQVMVAGNGTVVQQEPGNCRVGGAGDRTAQRCPVSARPARPGRGVGAGAQQQLGHGQQAAGPGRVQAVPP
jgi:hypothetical protein